LLPGQGRPARADSPPGRATQEELVVAHRSRTAMAPIDARLVAACDGLFLGGAKAACLCPVHKKIGSGFDK